VSSLVIGLALFLAPFLGVVILSYCIGRGDGRRAEQRRREQLARGLTPSRSPSIVRS
jgi:hypothetical protein